MNIHEQNGRTHREEVCPGKKDQLDPRQLQAELEKKNSPEMWRSLEELAGNPEVREMMHREFPKGASEWMDSVSRRGFRSEEHTSELQSHVNLVCRLLLEKKKKKKKTQST